MEHWAKMKIIQWLTGSNIDSAGKGLILSATVKKDLQWSHFSPPSHLIE